MLEFLTFPMSRARRARLARVENERALRAAHARGKGVLLLRAISQLRGGHCRGHHELPEAHGRVHFVRRPFKPRWLENFVAGRSAAWALVPFPSRVRSICSSIA
jgi:hypothetical protein